MKTLRLPPTVYQQIRAHGEETYPNECCGALLGVSSPDGWLVQQAVPAGNTRTDSAHNRYNISPAELVKIEREARRLGMGIAGFYHSHPDHPAQWSPTDFAAAMSLRASYRASPRSPTLFFSKEPPKKTSGSNRNQSR
jgi:proteasome lid subunit RPN8/RPN11